MIPTWAIAVAIYLVIGLVVVGIGLVTMIRSGRSHELLKPAVLLRTMWLGFLAFVFWPAMVVLGVVWQFRAGRRWIIERFGTG